MDDKRYINEFDKEQRLDLYKLLLITKYEKNSISFTFKSLLEYKSMNVNISQYQNQFSPSQQTTFAAKYYAFYPKNIYLLIK